MVNNLARAQSVVCILFCFAWDGAGFEMATKDRVAGAELSLRRKPQELPGFRSSLAPTPARRQVPNDGFNALRFESSNRGVSNRALR